MQRTDLGEVVIGFIIGVIVIILAPPVIFISLAFTQQIGMLLLIWLVVYVAYRAARKFRLLRRFDRASNRIIIPVCLALGALVAVGMAYVSYG